MRRGGADDGGRSLTIANDRPDSLPDGIQSDEDLGRVAASWVKLGRDLRAIDEDARVREAKAVVLSAEARKKEIRDALGASEAFYRPMIERYVKGRLQGKRSYETALITVKFVAVNQPTVDVVDEKLALPYLTKHCPEAIVCKPSIAKKGFTVAFLAMIGKKSKAALAKVGLRLTPAHDNMHLELAA